MTNLNNKILVSWAVLILDEKASIDDVPVKLQAGVQEVLDYFTQAVDKPNSTKSYTDATGTTTTTSASEPTADLIANADKAVADTTK